MREMGLKGSTRGYKTIRTTFSDPNRPTPEDLVQRIFHATAPNQLWVADFTYVIDACSKAIVGLRVSTRMTADLTLDALEQALWAKIDTSAGTVEDVELGTLEWVHWSNNKRLLSSIGYVPPAENEAIYYTENNRLVESGLK